MFRGVVQGSFPAAIVVQGQACLKGSTSHSHRPFLCQFSRLMLANNPPHSKMASSICGGFLPETRCWGLAWLAASQSSSKSAHVCAEGSSCVILKLSSFQSLPARSVSPFLHGAFRGVTSSRIPLLSTVSAKMPVLMLCCWSTRRIRGLPFDRSQLFRCAVLGSLSLDWARMGITRCNAVHLTHDVHGR